MMIIRSAQLPADMTESVGIRDRVLDADPLQIPAAQVFAGELAEASERQADPGRGPRIPGAASARGRLAEGEVDEAAQPGGLPIERGGYA